MHELWALMLALVTAFLQQTPPKPPPDTTPWPVEGVYHLGQASVTAPKLTSENKANYTAEAVRARIQGVVVLQCIVEADGSVGPVRVVRSLDPVYGLDDQAIRTVRQWRFAPGMKDGVPVRFEVSVELSFTLRDGPEKPVVSAPTVAPFTWPDAFVDGTGRADTPQSGWIDESAETSRLSVRFARPGDWSILPAASNGRIVTLHTYKGAGSRSLTISEFGPAPLTLSTPMSQSTIDSFFVQTAQRGFPAGLKPLRSGQLEKADGLWLWFEMAAPTIDTSNEPGAGAELLQSRYSGVHIWSFATTVNGQMVDVFCTVLHGVNATDQEKAEDIRRAGIEFGAMLRRMTVRPK